MREKKKILEKDFEIRNKQGLHARPAALFVQTANQFGAEIEIVKDDVVVSGKSIMGIMTLAAETGSTVTVRIQGADAELAMNAVEKLFGNNFGEAE
jgi:phosphocarrier protein HPr